MKLVKLVRLLRLVTIGNTLEYGAVEVLMLVVVMLLVVVEVTFGDGLLVIVCW